MSKICAGLFFLGVSVALPAKAEEGGAKDDPPAGAEGVAPTLEWLRECIIRRGVAARLVRIETLDRNDVDGGVVSGVMGDLRRIVFWTKTRRLTQTVVIAIVGDGSYVRVQSCDLACAEPTHAKLQKLMAYVLDRNFAVVGAQFARDATDGEVALRADVPCSSGLSEAVFLQTLERVLKTADDEAPRLWALLGKTRSLREDR